MFHDIKMEQSHLQLVHELFGNIHYQSNFLRISRKKGNAESKPLLTRGVPSPSRPPSPTIQYGSPPTPISPPEEKRGVIKVKNSKLGTAHALKSMGRDALFNYSQNKREAQIKSVNKMVSESPDIENQEDVQTGNVKAARRRIDVHNSKKLEEQRRIVMSNYKSSMEKAQQKLYELQKHLENVYKDMTALKTCDGFEETRTTSFQRVHKELCTDLSKIQKKIYEKRAMILNDANTPIAKVTEGLVTEGLFDPSKNA